MTAIGADQLTIDEGGDAGILGAGTEFVGRDQAIDDGIDHSGFIGVEEQKAARFDRHHGIGLVGVPRQDFCYDAGWRRRS